MKFRLLPSARDASSDRWQYDRFIINLFGLAMRAFLLDGLERRFCVSSRWSREKVLCLT